MNDDDIDLDERLYERQLEPDDDYDADEAADDPCADDGYGDL